MVQNKLGENNTIQSKSEEVSRLKRDTKKIWQHVGPNLINLVNITALLTVAGFFVVQSYLASFSKLFTFNISVTQYLAAGVNLMLAIIWKLILPILGYSLVLVSLYLLGKFCISKSKRVHTFWTSFLRPFLPFYRRIQRFLRVLWSLYQITASALFVLFVILLALVYGTSYYAQSPRMFGGGMPADVILIFREEQPTQNSIWSFPINSTNPRQSEQVQLLIELTDGVIVRDPSTGVVVIVKNDVLQGIIDAPVSNIVSSPTATPIQLLPTPTP